MADEFTKAALYGIKTFNKKVKEKIGMGKLIELYYEHKLDLLKRDMRRNGATEREIEIADIEKVDEDELEKNLNKLSELKPFIKWLVENDKIDLRKLSYKNIYMSDYGSSDDIFLAYNKGEQGIIYTVDYYESLLMLLSISDTPIEDLISYLK